MGISIRSATLRQCASLLFSHSFSPLRVLPRERALYKEKREESIVTFYHPLNYILNATLPHPVLAIYAKLRIGIVATRSRYKLICALPEKRAIFTLWNNFAFGIGNVIGAILAWRLFFKDPLVTV